MNGISPYNEKRMRVLSILYALMMSLMVKDGAYAKEQKPSSYGKLNTTIFNDKNLTVQQQGPVIAPTPTVAPTEIPSNISKYGITTETDPNPINDYFFSHSGVTVAEICGEEVITISYNFSGDEFGLFPQFELFSGELAFIYVPSKGMVPAGPLRDKEVKIIVPLENIKVFFEDKKINVDWSKIKTYKDLRILCEKSFGSKYLVLPINYWEEEDTKRILDELKEVSLPDTRNGKLIEENSAYVIVVRTDNGEIKKIFLEKKSGSKVFKLAEMFAGKDFSQSNYKNFNSTFAKVLGIKKLSKDNVLEFDLLSNSINNGYMRELKDSFDEITLVEKNKKKYYKIEDLKKLYSQITDKETTLEYEWFKPKSLNIREIRNLGFDMLSEEEQIPIERDYKVKSLKGYRG